MITKLAMTQQPNFAHVRENITEQLQNVFDDMMVDAFLSVEKYKGFSIRSPFFFFVARRSGRRTWRLTRGCEDVATRAGNSQKKVATKVSGAN